MSRRFTKAALAAAVALIVSPAAAQQHSGPQHPYAQQPYAGQQQAAGYTQAPQPVQQTGYALGSTLGLPAANQALPNVPLPGYGPTLPGKRPFTQAGLYPSPVHYTPPWSGGTIVTNEAFAPHEMLYPHQYRAMYGPYYYEVRGKSLWTPLGMRTFEKWKLRGTEVEVKYHDHIKFFSGFHPPR